MRITFFSNFMNHHQQPLSLEMVKIIGDGYRFVATEPVPSDRLELGYHNLNNEKYVIKAYENNEAKQHAAILANTSDAVIIGSAPELYIRERINKGKLTFRYSERLFKRGLWRAFNPKNIFRQLCSHYRDGKAPLYLLCAGAYTAYDYSLYGNYIGKTFKWGYFPDFENIKHMNKFIQEKNVEIPIIVWVGRLIGWKHPELAIEVANYLKSKGYEFRLKIIGIGILESRLYQEVHTRGLENYVEILGPMSPENVRIEMKKSSIYLFTSDFQEGWGAVLNEAMNSGCSIVACQACGSTPYLIEHNRNGFVYKYGDKDKLCEYVEELVREPNLRKKFGTEAYKTIKKEWNAKEAASRLVHIIDNHLKHGEIVTPFRTGPCSVAEIMR